MNYDNVVPRVSEGEKMLLLRHHVATHIQCYRNALKKRSPLHYTLSEHVQKLENTRIISYPTFLRDLSALLHPEDEEIFTKLYDITKTTKIIRIDTLKEENIAICIFADVYSLQNTPYPKIDKNYLKWYTSMINGDKIEDPPNTNKPDPTPEGWYPITVKQYKGYSKRVSNIPDYETFPPPKPIGFEDNPKIPLQLKRQAPPLRSPVHRETTPPPQMPPPRSPLQRETQKVGNTKFKTDITNIFDKKHTMRIYNELIKNELISVQKNATSKSKLYACVSTYINNRNSPKEALLKCFASFPIHTRMLQIMNTSVGGQNIITGPKGGQYYMRGGRKIYLQK